jgi:hypothetical protein
VDKGHLWHMQILAELCAVDDLPHPTAYVVVDTTDPESERAGTAWWNELTERGSEGRASSRPSSSPAAATASSSPRSRADPLTRCVEPDETPLASGERDLDVVGRFEPDLRVREDVVIPFLVLLHPDLGVEARDLGPGVEIASPDRDLVEADLFAVGEVLPDEGDVPRVGGGRDAGKALRVVRDSVALESDRLSAGA